MRSLSLLALLLCTSASHAFVALSAAGCLPRKSLCQKANMACSNSAARLNHRLGALRGMRMAESHRVCLVPNNQQILVDVKDPPVPRQCVDSAVVVGAGIVGVSIADALARHGCKKVTVVDRLPRARGEATPTSWAWVNANSKKPKDYQELNILGMKAWDVAYPGMVEWCGGLLLSEAEEQSQPTYDFDKLTATSASELEPTLNKAFLALHEHELFHFAQEGHVDPVAAVSEIASAARSRGVEFLFDVEVQGLLTNSEGTVNGVLGTRGNAGDVSVKGDVVVLANGVEVERLARTAGFNAPMLHSPGSLAHIDAGRQLRLGKIVVSSDVHVLQRADGRLVVGESKEAGGASSAAFAVQQQNKQQPHRPENTNSGNETESGERMLRKAHQVLDGLQSAEVQEVTVGNRPMPADGLPMVGLLGGGGWSGAYVAVMHSGVTLAPFVGGLVAIELCGGMDAALLEGFRPTRFDAGGDGERGRQK